MFFILEKSGYFNLLKPPTTTRRTAPGTIIQIAVEFTPHENKVTLVTNFWQREFAYFICTFVQGNRGNCLLQSVQFWCMLVCTSEFCKGANNRIQLLYCIKKMELYIIDPDLKATALLLEFCTIHC